MTLKDMFQKLNIGLPSRKDETVTNEKLRKLRRTVRLQIFLSIGAILLAVVLLFAMTAAWYTNVAKTGSLNFHAESWGYDAERITFTQTDIDVAPGVSGIVPVSIDNTNYDSSVRIGISFSKSEMNGASSSDLSFLTSKPMNAPIITL